MQFLIPRSKYSRQLLV